MFNYTRVGVNKLHGRCPIKSKNHQNMKMFCQLMRYPIRKTVLKFWRIAARFCKWPREPFSPYERPNLFQENYYFDKIPSQFTKNIHRKFYEAIL